MLGAGALQSEATLTPLPAIGSVTLATRSPGAARAVTDGRTASAIATSPRLESAGVKNQDAWEPRCMAILLGTDDGNSPGGGQGWPWWSSASIGARGRACHGIRATRGR